MPKVSVIVPVYKVEKYLCRNFLAVNRIRNKIPKNI